MKVLTASSLDTDARTTPGEHVVLSVECDRPGCACGQLWLGLHTGQTCTIATVTDDPYVTGDDLVEMLAALLQRTAVPGYTEDDARQDAAEAVDQTLAIADEHRPGARLRRAGDEIHLDSTRPRRRRWPR